MKFQEVEASLGCEEGGQRQRNYNYVVQIWTVENRGMAERERGRKGKQQPKPRQPGELK